ADAGPDSVSILHKGHEFFDRFGELADVVTLKLSQNNLSQKFCSGWHAFSGAGVQGGAGRPVGTALGLQFERWLRTEDRLVPHLLRFGRELSIPNYYARGCGLEKTLSGIRRAKDHAHQALRASA